jgi:hypothetical protein
MLGAVLSLLRADAPRQITGAPQNWPRWAVLLPHVLAATSHFDIQRQDAGGADAAGLLDRAATYLQVQARLAEARPLAERALAIDETAYGPDHPEVAIRLTVLLYILYGWGSWLGPGRWPNGPWPSTRLPTAPTTPPSPPT